jgi:hypothetical protein
MLWRTSTNEARSHSPSVTKSTVCHGFWRLT